MKIGHPCFLKLLLAALALMFVLCLPVASQTRQWIQQVGTSSADVQTSVAVDSSGNVYVAGYTDGALGGASQGNTDAFLAQYDGNGNLLWIRQFGTADYDDANDVAVDSTGSVYVTGSTSGRLGGNHYGVSDAWLAKFDSSGAPLWIQQLGTASLDVATSVAVDNISGDVCVTGYTEGSLNETNKGARDAWIAKYRSTGLQDWIKQLGTTGTDEANGIAVDPVGNVTITGSTTDNLGGSNQGATDAWAAQFDPSGTLVWRQQLGTVADDTANGVAADSSGNIYLTGSTLGSLQGTNLGGSDAWVAQYTSGGFFQWVRQFGTTSDDAAKDGAVDGADNVYLTGNTLGSLGDVNQGGADAWAARFDNAGARVWTQQLGSTSDEYSKGIAVSGSCEIYLTGDTLGTLGAASSGREDGWVARYSEYPTVINFAPTSGATGTSVTIRGTNFYGVTSVQFNGAPAVFNVTDSSHITATLPAAASTGRITVTTSCNTVTSATNFTVTTPPAVTLSATPASRTINAGQSTTYTISLNRANYPGSVSLSVSGLPTGATATFNPSSTTGGSSTLTVNTTTGTATGTRTLTISGTAASVRITNITVTLRVNPVSVNLSASPTSQTVIAGQSTTYAININRTNFTGAISLYVSGFWPVGMFSFAPNQTTGNSSSLTVTTIASTQTGTFTVTINGTATGITIAPITVTLTVNPIPSVRLTASPASRTVTLCGTTTYTININRVNFTGAVNLSASGLPAGTTHIFSPNQTTGNSSTLTVTVPNGTPTGAWTVVISGTAPSLSIAPINITLTTFGFTWLKQLDISADQIAYQVAVDDSGNLYIAGSTDGDMDGTGPETYAGGGDAWVAKYNSLGTLQWNKQIGTTAYDRATGVAVDRTTGSVYITGFTNGDIDGAGPGTSLKNAAFLAKYSSVGTLQWVRQLDSYSDIPDYNGLALYCVAVNSVTGDVYITGDTSIDLDGPGPDISHWSYDAFLAKYDSGGTLQWTRQWGTGDDDYFRGVAIDSNGDIYVAGEIFDEVGGPLWPSRILVAKYNSSGTLQWDTVLDGSGNSGAYGIAVSGGDVYVTGYTNVDLDGPGPAQGSGAFVARYNGGGTLQWVRTLGTLSDYSYDVALDGSGGVYLTGHTWGDIDGSGPGISHGYSDAFVAKYDGSGTLQWVKQLGSGSNDYSYGVAVDSSNRLYVTGSTNGDMDGPGAGTHNEISGGEDAWVAQVSSSLTPVPFITNFTTTSGLPGTTVTITGGNFTGATPVRFNGTSAIFTVNSSTQITATVPDGLRPEE